VHDGFGAFQSALRSFDVLTGNLRTHLVGLKLLQSRHHYFGKVTLFVTVRDLDGFVELAFLQSACHGRSEGAGLFTRGAIGQQPVDHDADRPRRHDEQANDHQFGGEAHLCPQ